MNLGAPDWCWSKRHKTTRPVYDDRVALAPKRINVTLDPLQAAKLARLAERSHLQEGTLARSLLSVAIDAADPDTAHVHLMLDSIPGAIERAQEGLAQAKAGDTVSADEL